MQRMASVLLVALSKNFGGADVRVQQTAQALQAAGRRYAVAVLAGSELHRKLTAEALQVRPLDLRRSDPRLALALGRLIRDEAYDVVDAHNPQSQLWAAIAARATGCRGLLATVHSVYRRGHGPLSRGLLHESVLHLNRMFGGRFMAISTNVRDYLLEIGIPPGRITFSQNGIDAGGSVAPAGLRAALGWDEQAFVVAVIARLEAVKGHRLLLHALARLKDSQPSLRTLIVGRGREHAALRQEAARLGLAEVVHFAGFRADIANILAESDLFCLPSLNEGLPYAVLEAAQGGVPILASAVGGLPDLFTHGVDAHLLEPGNEDSLVEGLRWALTHRRECDRLAAAAARLVAERFDLRRMTAETFALYDQQGGVAPPSPAARRAAAARPSPVNHFEEPGV